MHYDFIAIPDCDIPTIQVAEYGYLIHTYVSESNKTASMWKAIPEPHLDFTPHPKTNSIRTILKHQLLSESRFFREFVGTAEVDVAPLVPPDHASSPAAYLDSYIHLVKQRLPQLANGSSSWWHETRPFFGYSRERIWIFWRRVLHTCHHRTQVQSWLRLAGAHVPTIYGPSGDISWDGATPTYS